MSREFSRRGLAAVIHADGIADRHYEISTRVGEIGVLTALVPSPASPADAARRLCHEALWSRSDPCRNCPFLPPPPPHDDAVRSGIIGTTNSGALALVTGRRTNPETIRIVQHSIADELLGQLLESRLEQAASEASLSPREREVLRLLMIGRSLGEIATALAITVRTAKYHQANLLQKLGADSRLDLLRLLSLGGAPHGIR